MTKPLQYPRPIYLLRNLLREETEGPALPDAKPFSSLLSRFGLDPGFPRAESS